MTRYLLDHYYDEDDYDQGEFSTLANMIMGHTVGRVKKPGKVSIRHVRRLTHEEWVLLRELEPEIVRKMMRLRFRWTNMSVSDTWLNENCTGFFYIPNNDTNMIFFENEDDAALFKMTFEGT